MASDDAEHRLLTRLYGAAPVETHRLASPRSDLAFWRGRLSDRRGEVVFGIIRRLASGECMVLTRASDYPEGVYRVPSGGIAPAETVIDALWREVAEEIGLPFRVAAYAGKIEYVIPGGASDCDAVFPSYCFLLEQLGDGEAHPQGPAPSEVAATRNVGIEQLVGVAARLAALGDRWADWGDYRAHSTGRIARAWARRRAEVDSLLRGAAALACGRPGPLDISHGIGPAGAASYPGDAPPSFVPGMLRPRGAACGWHTTRWEMSAHAGTHVDAPAHYFAGGETIDQISLGRLCGPAVVFDARRATAARRPAEAGDLVPADLDLARDRIALIRLGLDGEIGAGRFPEELMGISAALAGDLIRLGVRAVGTDALSVDGHGESAAHSALLAAGVPIIELLHLGGVEEGPCGFAALPLRLVGAEAAPCRAIWWPADREEPVFGPPTGLLPRG